MNLKLMKSIAMVAIIGLFQVQAMEAPKEQEHAVYLPDPLFPGTLISEEQIKKGIELVKKLSQKKEVEFEYQPEIVTCEAVISDEHRFGGSYDFPPTSTENKHHICKYPYASRGRDGNLCVGYGGSKKVVKLSLESDRVIFFGPSKIHVELEFQAYEILNVFGFVSQQSPKIVTVEFANHEKIENILSSINFESLVKETKRRTWDHKNYFGIGDILIFNGRKNFQDVNYNLRLLSPLVRDYALWCFVGKPGCEEDSLNLIFKEINENEQTVCRLFLYDIYHKNINKSLFIVENIGNSYVESFSPRVMKRLYKEICEATIPAEKEQLWGRKDYRNSEFRGNEEEVNEIWLKLEPLLLTIYKEEFARLGNMQLS